MIEGHLLHTSSERYHHPRPGLHRDCPERGQSPAPHLLTAYQTQVGALGGERTAIVLLFCKQHADSESRRPALRSQTSGDSGPHSMSTPLAHHHSPAHCDLRCRGLRGNPSGSSVHAVCTASPPLRGGAAGHARGPRPLTYKANSSCNALGDTGPGLPLAAWT